MTTTYLLPPRFWIDHVDRGLRCGDSPDCPLRDQHETEDYGIPTSKGYRVELTDTDAKELLNDARHYSNYTTWGSHEGIGLQSSARATVDRLNS